MTATIIHNPKAGFDNLSKEDVLQALSHIGYQMRYLSSKEEYFDKALEHPGDLVIVAGGDGTITKTAKRLVGRNIPMAIFPIGTANNIATTLETYGPSLLKRRIWDFSKYCLYDVGTVKIADQEHFFFESVGFGLLAKLISQSAQEQQEASVDFKDRKAKIQFGIGLLRDILYQKQPAFYHIILDGSEYSGRYLMVEIMNIKSIGPGILLAPNADPADGYFDIVLIPAGEKGNMVKYLEQLYAGENAAFNIKPKRASHIYISTEETEFHIDDETVDIDANTKVKITMTPQALKFV